MFGRCLSRSTWNLLCLPKKLVFEIWFVTAAAGNVAVLYAIVGFVVCFGKRTFIWFVCVRLWVNCCVHVSLGGIQCFVWFWTMELWSPETDNQKRIMFGVHWRQCASCSDGRSELFYCRNRKMGKTNSQDCVTFVSSVA